MEIIVDILGWIGSIALTIAYLLISRNKITAQTHLYQWLNLFGSLTLIVNSTYYGAYPSTFLNVVWVAIGIYAIYNLTKKKEIEIAED